MTRTEPPFPLRDAHLHLPEHGEQLGSPDLSGCASVGECLAIASDAVAGGVRMRADWTVCEFARPSSWEDQRFPTREELDGVSPDTPLVVRSFDHHSASANSAALDRAGVKRDHPETDGSGAVWESGYARLFAAVPARTDAEERACIIDAQRDLRGHGFVEVCDMHTTPACARTLVAMDASGELDLVVRLYATPDAFERVRAIVGDGTDRVRFGGLKLFTDGTLSGRTASMLDPYAEGLPDHPNGCPLIDDDLMRAHFRVCDGLGVDVACHAIGDAAVRRLLDLDEELATELGRTPRGTLRIEHAQFVHPSDVERLAGRARDTGRVVIGMQPSHLLTDIEAVRRHTPHAESRVFALRSIVDAYAIAGLDPELHVELGSDTPVVSPAPGDTLRGACDRRRAGMPVAEALNPGEAVGEDEAWSLYRARALPA
ncbi:MAG: amidohydrolase family protein [Planctomycetota bacterium]